MAADIRSAGSQAAAFVVDLAVERQVEALVAQAIAQFGRLDVLHNNAALTDSEFLSGTQP